MTKKLSMILIATVLIFTILMPTFAFSKGDLVDYLTPITDSEKMEHIRQVRTIHKLEDVIINSTIEQFDVDSHGSICCVSAKASEQKMVWIIEANSTVRTYTLNSQESIEVCWLNDNILIFFLRSNYAVSYDLEGNITGAYETSDATRSYRHEHIKTTSKAMNRSTYYLERTAGELLFLGGYGRLLKKDEAGNITTIYDIEEVRPMRTSWGKIGIWMILIPQIYCGICALIWLIVKRRKRKKLAE